MNLKEGHSVKRGCPFPYVGGRLGLKKKGREGTLPCPEHSGSQKEQVHAVEDSSLSNSLNRPLFCKDLLLSGVF